MKAIAGCMASASAKPDLVKVFVIDETFGPFDGYFTIFEQHDPNSHGIEIEIPYQELKNYRDTEKKFWAFHDRIHQMKKEAIKNGAVHKERGD